MLREKCTAIDELILVQFDVQPHVHLPDHSCFRPAPTAVDPKCFRDYDFSRWRSIYLGFGVFDAHDSFVEFVQIVECCLRSDRINKHETLSILHIQISHRRELFLDGRERNEALKRSTLSILLTYSSSRVENFQGILFTIDFRCLERKWKMCLQSRWAEGLLSCKHLRSLDHIWAWRSLGRIAWSMGSRTRRSVKKELRSVLALPDMICPHHPIRRRTAYILRRAWLKDKRLWLKCLFAVVW